MNKRWFAAFLLFPLLSACSPTEHPAPEPAKQVESAVPVPGTVAISNLPDAGFVVSSISPAELVKGLRVSPPEVDKSNDGLRRVRWKILGEVGAGSSLEAIGNNRHQAKVFGGQCMEFDAAGNSAGWPDGSHCATLFRQLTLKIVDKPEAADEMMAAAGLLPHRKGRLRADLEAGSLYYELDNDGFFFLRDSSVKE